MPRRIDTDQRRAELAEAVWRVVLRDGVAKASIRTVAKEAGVSSGSLRHVFATHADLLAFAMQRVAARTIARIEAITPGDAVAVLEQLLPLDDERRAEMEVWLDFAAHARGNDRLASLRDTYDDQLRALCARIAPDSPDELHALLDGLALHAVQRPDTWPPDRQRDILRRALATGP